MITRQVKFSDTDDVQDFVKAAGGCDFDIDVVYERVVIDAKSILGVLSFGFSKVLTVKYNEQNDDFESVVEKYAVVA